MKPLSAIVGATGTGKTQLAVAVSRQFPVEVVSCDSGQVYRDLNIGTAKPTPEEQAQLRHHLIDILPPTAQWSAAEFAEAAERCIDDIRGRGAIPLLVGGNGLWYRALTRGIFEAPSIDEAIRASVRSELVSKGSERMHAELALVDPVAASRIQPRDPQRIGRAIEVFRQTGTPISKLQDEHGFKSARFRVSAVILDWERERLRSHLGQRVQAMFDSGLIEETEACLSSGVPPDAPGLSTIGYKQAVLHLEGALRREEAIELTIHATRQYAKRQRNWFKSEPHLHWLSKAPPLEQVVECLRPGFCGV